MSTQVTTRKARLLEIFHASGMTMSAADLGMAGYSEGLWSDSAIHSLAMTQIVNTARNVLNEAGVDGAPNSLNRYVPVTQEDGTVVMMLHYVQPAFWEYDDSVTWLRRRVKSAAFDLGKMRRALQCFMDRWERDYDGIIPAGMQMAIEETQENGD